MRTPLIFLFLLSLSGCALDNELNIPCAFDTRGLPPSTEEVDVIQNGFKIGSVSNIAQVSKTGLAKTHGIMHFPKGKCISLNAKFELYKPDETREQYVVIAHNIQEEGRCLATHDTVLVKDFKPISLPIDSVSAKLIDSVITRIRRH